jgi:nucleolar complex protein 2
VEEEEVREEESNELLMKEEDVQFEKGDFEDFLKEELANEEDEEEEDFFGDKSDSNQEEGGEEEEEEEEEVETHTKDLEQLKERDPEFYKFLQENDPGALDFEIEEEEEQEEEEEGEWTNTPSWVMQAERGGRSGKTGNINCLCSFFFSYLYSFR